MRARVALALILLTSFCAGCTSYPKALEMEKRASYGDAKSIGPILRKKQRVEEVYVGRRVLPSGDLFLGGRLLLAISEPGSIFDSIKKEKN